METMQAILSRKSVRSYTGKKDIEGCAEYHPEGGESRPGGVGAL